MQIDEDVLREVETAMKPLTTLIELVEEGEITGLTYLDDFGVWLHADGEPVWLVDTITLHTIGRGVAALANLRKAMEPQDVLGLTDAEMREQGSRCGCRGTDEYCPCQNVPFRSTLDARKAMEAKDG